MSKLDRIEDPRTTRAREQYIGKEYEFNNGNTDIKMKVVDFDSYRKVTVQVGDTDIYIDTCMGNVKRGMVTNPFKENSPIAFTDPKYEYLNCIFRTNQGYLIRVLNCEDRDHVLYEFLDTCYQGVTAMHNILAGQVRNPYHRNKFGGFLGPDKTYRSDEFEWLYTIWTTFLMCYGEYITPNGLHKRDDTILNDDWYCYGDFAKWYMYYYSQLNPNFKYTIDVNLKLPFYSQFTGGKKFYGPSSCLLVPVELEKMIESQSSIKEAARYYKEQNALLDEAYNIIMNM